MVVAKLMDHQEEGAAFLVGRKSGILAFEQGLGKTLIAIEAFCRLRAIGDADRLLVICPNSLKRNWVVEVAKFTPWLTVDLIGGTMRQRRDALAATATDIVVVNYEAARSEIVALQAFMRRHRTVLVLDESHCVKNRRSLTSTAARHFAHLSDFRWLLSGTPVTNSPADIWTQVNLVSRCQPLGSFERFMLEHGDADRSRWRQEELARKLDAYLLRRTKEECLDLPEKTFLDLFVALPPWQRQLYDTVRDGIVRNVKGMSADAFAAFAPTALTRLLRLSQIASDPALVFPDKGGDPAKFSHLDRVLEDLVVEGGRKVIVWSYYVGTIKKLADRYADLGTVTLFGETPTEERQEIVKRFQDDPGTRVFIGNPAAAGSGFTLTAATHTVYETLTWRYDLYAQSQDRNHRIGQSAPVTYIRLIAEDTIDEVIVQTLERKAAMATTILGDDFAGWPVAGVTPEAFCEMLRSNRLPG